MARTIRLCFSGYCVIGMWPHCQGPYISLPIPQILTPYGAGWPFAARSRPSRVVAAPFTYSTSSAAEWASPRPEFTAR